MLPFFTMRSLMAGATWEEMNGKHSVLYQVAAKDGDAQRIKIWQNDVDFMFQPKNSLWPIFLGNLDFLLSPEDWVV